MPTIHAEHQRVASRARRASGPSRPASIAICLPEPLARRLREALDPEQELLIVPTWDDVVALARRRPVGLLVIDPAEAHLPAAPVLQMDAADAPPIVVYTTVGAEQMRAAVLLARAGVSDLVIAGLDDAPERLRALLGVAQRAAPGEEFVARLAPRLLLAPPALRQAIAALFRGPDAVPDVSALSRLVGLSRRRLDRWLERTGLPLASDLLTAARLLRVHALLQAGGATVEEAARAAGYTPRVLARHLRELGGLRPSSLRTLTREQLGDRLEARMAERRRR